MQNSGAIGLRQLDRRPGTSAPVPLGYPAASGFCMLSRRAKDLAGMIHDRPLRRVVFATLGSLGDLIPYMTL